MAYTPFDLTGKVALVTGGNSGIGLGMAKGLMQAGAAVSIWGTSEEKNAAATVALRQVGDKVLALKCDVADEKQVNDSMAEVVSHFGRLDACFANAGVGNRNRNPFFEFETAEWRRVIGVNLDGVFFTFRAAAKQMVEQGEGGTLVATSSGTAIQGAARNQAYASAKGGLVSMVLSLATELARWKITANTIIPGWIETPMTSRAFGDEKFVGAVLKRIPARRWGTGDDFAGIAVYLMSDAARYHTGDTIVIDGGFSKF
jgi:NAD(P)-dependent dehydrogenase (short-subunit alcohol dehydrogenase family)